MLQEEPRDKLVIPAPVPTSRTRVICTYLPAYMLGNNMVRQWVPRSARASQGAGADARVPVFYST